MQMNGQFEIHAEHFVGTAASNCVTGGSFLNRVLTSTPNPGGHKSGR
jgi:hypothetical protein